MSSPRATVRLQFHRGFTLDDACTVVGYYADLGISHIYASPLTTARPGSTHGYDVIDYGAINPELGGFDALARLGTTLRARSMGLVLDIVPNHMAASEHNPWWRDLLAHGRDSRYADWFDIDWEPGDAELRGRVLAPFLAEPLENALASMRVGCEPPQRRYFVEIGGQRFPLAAGTLPPGEDAERILATYNGGSPAARERLRALLDRQHYRLAHWREAATRINWRRFFEIGDLVALRMDRDDVFEAVHRFVFRLYGDGLIDGVRVDHVDGIADPRVYCERLRAGLMQAAPGDDARTPYVVVEKILAHGETLHEDWRVDGTTGYDFMDQCSAVLHDASGAAVLDALWREAGTDADFEACVRAARREVATSAFAADIDAVVRCWNAVESADPVLPAPDADAMRAALVRVLEYFERYRTYLEPGRDDACERAVLEAATARAAAADGRARGAIERLRRRLIEAARDPNAPASALLRKFQQLTPPVAAKAVEDTAFYRYARLISRNEVGADPSRLASTVGEFHAECAARAERTSLAMLATATHDHKRGEDVRARLAVLSEIAPAWRAAVHRWRAMNSDLCTPTGTAEAPSPADEYMLYQTIVGAWPCGLEIGDAAALGRFLERLLAWQQKALREAKRRTSWADPDAGYERACAEFLRAVFDPARPALSELGHFAARIAPVGALNSLVQALLRSTAPGVPDLYQGCDYWDFSLVDPDNRRAVDHAARRDSLVDDDIAALAAHWRDGRVKQALIARVLRWRTRHGSLFARGRYVRLAVDGPLRDHVVAFMREHDGDAVLVLAARHAAHLIEGDAPRIPPERWRDTLARLPSGGGTWRDVVARKDVGTTGDAIRLADAFETLPLAVLAPADTSAVLSSGR